MPRAATEGRSTISDDMAGVMRVIARLEDDLDSPPQPSPDPTAFPQGFRVPPRTLGPGGGAPQCRAHPTHGAASASVSAA